MISSWLKIIRRSKFRTKNKPNQLLTEPPFTCHAFNKIFDILFHGHHLSHLSREDDLKKEKRKRKSCCYISHFLPITSWPLNIQYFTSRRLILSPSSPLPTTHRSSCFDELFSIKFYGNKVFATWKNQNIHRDDRKGISPAGIITK